MRMRMDELGPQHAGRTIAWRPADDDPRYAAGRKGQPWPLTRQTLTRAKVLHRHEVSGYGDAFPDGVVVLVCEPVDSGRVPGPFYVGAHWPVDVEDAP